MEQRVKVTTLQIGQTKNWLLQPLRALVSDPITRVVTVQRTVGRVNCEVFTVNCTVDSGQWVE